MPSRDGVRRAKAPGSPASAPPAPSPASSVPLSVSEGPATGGLARAARLGHRIQRLAPGPRVGSRVAAPTIQRNLSLAAQPVGDALAIDGVGAVVAEPVVETFAALLAQGWTAANVAALIRDFGQVHGGLNPGQWVAVASAHANLANQRADVTAFARIGLNWTPANLATYAGLFGAEAGGRAANVWTAMAAAHAGVVDQPAALALAARAGWLTADLTALFTQALVAGIQVAEVVALLATVGAAASTRAMVVAGWTGGDLGTFVGAARLAGLGTAPLAAFLATANVPAATVLMRGAWGAAALAQFSAGALGAGATPAALQLLMATAGFPASSFALVAGAWSATNVGQFCGGALAVNTPAATVQGLISTVNVPQALRDMVTAGWTLADLGQFSGTVQVGGVAAGVLLQLLQILAFRTGTVLMRGAGWTPANLGEFVVGIVGTLLAVADIAALINTANFGANSFPWIAAGFSARQVGQVCGAARLANGGAFTAVGLTAFLGTANAAAGAAALIGAWGAAAIGTTIGHCRTQAGGPDDGEMVQLLERANVAAGIGGAQIQAAWARSAATAAASGAPAWADVLAHLATFQATWLGGRNHVDGPMNVYGPYYIFGPRAPCFIGIELRGARIVHVEAGHSFEHHLFTYANCTRHGVGLNGVASFVAAGTDVPAELAALQASATAQGLGSNAVCNRFARGHFATQDDEAGYRIGVLSSGVGFWYPLGNYVYPTYLSQAYPLAGTDIVGRDLVAIGRVMGQIP